MTDEPKRLARNAALCQTCMVVIESKYRHDFQVCDCDDEDTRIYVDGGLDYQRVGWGPRSSFSDLSEYE